LLIDNDVSDMKKTNVDADDEEEEARDKVDFRRKSSRRSIESVEAVLAAEANTESVGSRTRKSARRRTTIGASASKSKSPAKSKAKTPGKRGSTRTRSRTSSKKEELPKEEKVELAKSKETIKNEEEPVERVEDEILKSSAEEQSNIEINLDNEVIQVEAAFAAEAYTESVGSRTRGLARRRTTVGASATKSKSPAKSKAKKPGKRGSGRTRSRTSRKKEEHPKEEKDKPVKTEEPIKDAENSVEKASEKDEVVESAAEEQSKIEANLENEVQQIVLEKCGLSHRTPVKNEEPIKNEEHPMEKATEKDEFVESAVEDQSIFEANLDNEVQQNDVERGGLSHRPLQFFIHFLLVVWILTYGVILVCAFDWWLYHSTPEEVDMMSERETCFILGLWMITIGLNCAAFGPRSKLGWTATTVSLALSFVAPSTAFTLPLCSIFGLDINVPTALLMLGLLGSLTELLAKPPKPQDAQDVEQTVEPSVTTEEQGEEEKEEEEDIRETTATATGPRSVIGKSVVVEKGFDVIFGKVIAYLPETREWVISFDDGFYENVDMNRVELSSAFKLYSKHLADSLKAMWRAGEL